MGTKTSSGFTIIESMLFLAISGLLVIVLVAGVGASVNIQRYQDATQSFKELVQRQYTALSNVENGRDNNWTCAANADPVPGGDEIRGQSECVMVGKYMRIDRGDISIYTVLARKTSNSIQVNDILRLRNNYILNASDDGVNVLEQRQMEWGTQIAKPSSGAGSGTPITPRVAGILFVRSPDSGQIYTFSSNTIPAVDSVSNATFTNMLVAGDVIPGQGAQMLCIEAGASGMLVNTRVGLYIPAFASGISAPELRTSDTLPALASSPAWAADGGVPKC